ncbi:pimeloyl-ACP methyl ester carboxylesterase [Microbacterium sp. SORGH_AS 1204]|uniref:epoxide hydrolase family protein n=1 Tax=Microbacterium sp. SORGH_AS_1204 TaxID=3041785 RepID=UPI00279500C5|nr:epoxide hydrolase [Microbacterium sp. SORGH_AS_1204]MDQ1137750.1 pimeloyl-ACP methyl ester carboxylesterase [Microbacterium sp. SORGH_AS_1204]
MIDDHIEPFEKHATDEELAALRERLASARFPERETTRAGASGRERWSQGVPLADMVDLVEYWRTGYDWRAFERRLTEIGQFRTVVDGLGIHLLHRRSPRPDATPLVMTHGWPGSIAEFVDVIDELAEPQDAETPAFHVVAPSLPGFGYSDRPTEEGWGTERIAAAWVRLMGGLGYDRFLAHGGDWGGPITIALGGRFPEHVIGIHTTTPVAPPGLGLDVLDAAEREWVEHTRAFERNRLAYARVMATSPQTIGYSLVDSPVGLLAWIAEKFAEWSDTVDVPFRDHLARPPARQRHAVLADRDRGVGGAHLLRESPVARSRPAGGGAGGVDDVSIRHREAPAAVGRGAVLEHRAVAGAECGRALSGAGDARCLRARPAGGVGGGAGGVGVMVCTVSPRSPGEPAQRGASSRIY